MEVDDVIEVVEVEDSPPLPSSSSTSSSGGEEDDDDDDVQMIDADDAEDNENFSDIEGDTAVRARLPPLPCPLPPRVKTPPFPSPGRAPTPGEGCLLFNF